VQPSADWQVKSALVALQQDDPIVVAQAIAMLGKLHANSTVATVLARYRAHQSDRDVAEATANTLGQLRDSPDTTLPVLQEMLGSKEEPVRDAAVSALGEYKSDGRSAVTALVSLHEQGHLSVEDGVLFEHPPTSTALSLVGVINRQQVDALVRHATTHLAVAFSGIHDPELQPYAIGELMARLGRETKSDAQAQLLAALRALPTYTREELMWVTARVDRDQLSSFPVGSDAKELVTIEAAQLLAQILGDHADAELNGMSAHALARLWDLATAYDALAESHDTQSLPAWDRKRLDRVLIQGAESNPLISAIGHLGRAFPDAVTRLGPLLKCTVSGYDLTTVRTIAALQALALAGSNGRQLEDQLVGCVTEGRGFDLLVTPALKANQEAGGKAIDRLSALLTTPIDEQRAMSITSALLATGEYVPATLTQSYLPLRTRTAATWLGSGTNKAEAFRVLNSSLNDAMSHVRQPATKSDQWYTAEETARRVALAVAEHGRLAWPSDVDRMGMIDGLMAAWDVEPSSSVATIGPLLRAESVLEALASLGPLPLTTTVKILGHIYDEPGKHDPIDDRTIPSRYLFWGIVLSGADDRIVYGARWLAKDPQKDAIPTSLAHDDARLTLRGLGAILASAPPGSLRDNALTRLDQLVRTAAGWSAADLELLDDTVQVVANLKPSPPARTRAAVSDLRQTVSGDTPLKRIARLVPVAWFAALLILIVFAPASSYVHGALMNPWLRNLGSFGLIPLTLTIVPPARRHVLRRYLSQLRRDEELTVPAANYVVPAEDLLPGHFGALLEERRHILLLGPSGIGKTSYLRYLTFHYASNGTEQRPKHVVPVFIPLARYQGQDPFTAFCAELQTIGQLSDASLARWYLTQGGFALFLDGLNELAESDRHAVSAFINTHRKANYICVSSQQSYPPYDWMTAVSVHRLPEDKIRELLRRRLGDHAAEPIIAQLDDDTYALYALPQDLEFAIELVQQGKGLPRSTWDLYDQLVAPVFEQWAREHRADYPTLLARRAYEMLLNKEPYFDRADSPVPEDLRADLISRKILIERPPHVLLRHDLIRAFLAARHFGPQWDARLDHDGEKIDVSWLQMLEFVALDTIRRDPDGRDLHGLALSILPRHPNLAGDFVGWLHAHHPRATAAWYGEFSRLYGETLIESASRT
jgi:hypothetical protein